MPFSYDTFDHRLDAWIRRVAPSRVIDVGVGTGKVGRLVRAYSKACFIMGYEVDPDYMKNYAEEHRVYDIVINSDFYDIVLKYDLPADVFIFGDVLEHFPLSRAIDILDYCAYRCKYILIITPLRCAQGAWENHMSERHLCQLHLSDLVRFDIREYLIERVDNLDMQFFVIKGHHG